LSSFGQPSVITTVSISGTLLPIHAASSVHPAACSCWANPCEGLPAMNTTFFFACADADVVTSAIPSNAIQTRFMSPPVRC
jgi:hypothetical protein